MKTSHYPETPADGVVHQQRTAARHMRECRDVTRAHLARSRRLLAHGEQLLAISATRVRAPAGDAGRRAAALGPSLARAVMAVRARL